MGKWYILVLVELEHLDDARSLHRDMVLDDSKLPSTAQDPNLRESVEVLAERMRMRKFQRRGFAKQCAAYLPGMP